MDLMPRVLAYVFGCSAVLAAVGVVFIRNPIKGALSLIGCFFSLACLFVLQSAELVAVLEVLVYAGAIMVLFVFVLMLVEHKSQPIVPRDLRHRLSFPVKVGAVCLVGVNVGLLVWKAPLGMGSVLPEGFGHARMIGRTFLRDFLFQFELTSLLLLVGIVGAVIICRGSPKKS